MRRPRSRLLLAAGLAVGVVGAHPVAQPAARAADGAPAALPVAASVARPSVDAGAPGRPLEDRLEEIRRRIEGELVYPSGARWRDREGASVVEFEIASDGTAREIRLARSSGEPILDRAAERAVASARDLPYVWGRLAVPVRFTLAGSR